MDKPAYAKPRRGRSRRPQDRYFKPTEAADYLGSAVSALAKLRSIGGGPVFLRLGKAIRYRKRDLDGWMARTAASSTSEYCDGAIHFVE